MAGHSITYVIRFSFTYNCATTPTYYDRSSYTSHNKFNHYYKIIIGQLIMIGKPTPVIISLTFYHIIVLINLSLQVNYT